MEVLSLEEIGRTLDSDGCLEHLPFMPEMKSFCGKRFRVRHCLTYTCVEGYHGRLLPSTVTLEGAYCDGSSHDGCQKCCPLLWKLAWLRPDISGAMGPPRPAGAEVGETVCARTKRDDGRYFCQSAELCRATRYLRPASCTRCTAQYLAGNVGLARALQLIWVPVKVKLKTRLFGIGSVLPVGNSPSTPIERLGLQPGELVEVKTPGEIRLTLDPKGRNRGLLFTPHMLPFCGRQYRVRSRVERMILETTGEMRQLQNTVILEDVTCDGHTSLGGCSRHVFHLWREAWLRRVAPGERERQAARDAGA